MKTKEIYCTYATARRLKDLGFPVGIHSPNIRFYYNENGERLIESYVLERMNQDEHEKLCACPTQDLARRWLQEEYGVFIDMKLLPLTRERSWWRYNVHALVSENKNHKKWCRDSAMDDFDKTLEKALDLACEVIIGLKNQEWKDKVTYKEVEPSTEIKHPDIFKGGLLEGEVVDKLWTFYPMGFCPKCNESFEEVTVEKFDTLALLSGMAGYRIRCAKCGEVIATIVRIMS